MDYYLTPEKLEAVKAELKGLKTESRIEIADKLKRAKELGDLSENAEYSEARDEQSQLEQRIVELEDMVRNAVLIKKVHNKKGIVEIGSNLTVLKNNKETKIRIVGSNEARPEAGMISNESPLGRSLIGKSSGDIVKIKAPIGEITYKIVEIE